jgi:SAM-dependent methyltransferase
MHSNIIREKVKRDYNAIAEDFSDSRSRTWKDFDLFKSYLSENADVLDLGSGNGRLLLFLKKFKSYLGVDQSKNLIGFAEKQFPKNKFLVADMAHLPELKKVDEIFAIASFHHIPPLEHLDTLKNWKKLLKKDGYLFMTNWNLHQSKYLPFLIISMLIPSFGFRGTLIPWKNKLKRYYFAFNKRRIRKLLENAGYKVIYNEYVKNGEKTNIISGRNILTIARND